MKTRLFIASWIFFTQALGQNPLNLLSTTKGGSGYEVCYYNNHLYAGSANTLITFPLTGPNNSPGVASDSIRFISNIDYMVVRNNHLYVCANHDGLWKFDVSNPAQPAYVAHYAPASINESVYDIAFYGDSILVAAKTKVNLLRDNGAGFTFLQTVATFTGTTTRVRGIDIKDSLIGFTVGLSPGNSQDGVYLYGIKGLQQVSFYNDTQGDPQDVNFGINNKLLHVMGGTISSTIFNGRYYALDYTIPTNPTSVYSYTVNGFALLGSIAMPMNCTNINDTLYISTHGGGPINFTGAFWGQIYVFDARTPSVSLLTDLYAGLYHFDCDINPATRKMYVASEWYGVLTMDIADIYNEVQVSRTNTGGWCHGSAQAKTKLVEAAEGYGMRLFDVSNMQKPTLVADDTTRGFCRAISISDSADLAYGWYVTGKAFRVRDANNNLAFVKDTTGDPNVSLPTDFKKSRYHNGKVAVIEEYGLGNASHKILVEDVSIPTQAHLIATRQKNNIEDLLFHPTGVLLALAQDSLMVLNASTLATITSISPPLGGLQPFKAFAMSGDTLYVFYENVGEGIARYFYNSGLQTLTYLTANTHAMATTSRVFMACDNSLIYIGGTLDSLKALSKANLSEVAIYDHGADFVFDNLWGNTELYYNKGYLFMNEYMGQTSIFGPAPTSGMQNAHGEKNKLSVYPNPATDHFTLETGTKDECLVQIYDTQGKLMYMADVRSEKFTLSTTGFHRGLYFVSVTANGKETTTKLLIEK